MSERIEICRSNGPPAPRFNWLRQQFVTRSARLFRQIPVHPTGRVERRRDRLGNHAGGF
jgi:hypothetical protein